MPHDRREKSCVSQFSIGALMAICNCSALKAYQARCGLPGFGLNVLWIALSERSSAYTATSMAAALEEHTNSLHAMFSSARSFSSLPVPNSWWFPVTFWTYTSVSCMLQSSSLFLPCYEPADDGWALSMPRGAAGAAEEVKTADLLQQISSNSRLCCGSSVECHHFNCSLWNSS